MFVQRKFTEKTVGVSVWCESN